MQKKVTKDTKFQTKVGVKNATDAYTVFAIQNDYFLHPAFGVCYTLDYKVGNDFLLAKV